MQIYSGFQTQHFAGFTIPSNYVVSVGECFDTDSKLLSQGFEEANQFRLVMGVSSSSQHDRLAIQSLFLKVIGDKAIAKITNQDCIKFCGVLNQLPTNATKKFGKNYDPKFVIEEAKLKSLPLLSVKTKRKLCSLLAQDFKFFNNSDYSNLNFFSQKLFADKLTKKKNAYRDAFTREDYAKIIESSKFLSNQENDKRLKDDYRWIILLAIFTGLRLGEITQLHVADIKKISGVWCVSVCRTEDLDPTDDNYKCLKNCTSERFVPIHDQLIELGFLNKVKHQAKQGEVRLFSQIRRKKKGRHSAVVGDWFSRNKKAYFGITEPRKSFHSFRHTFANALKQASVDIAISASILGHEYGGETYGRYGKDYDPKILKAKGIDKIRFNIKWSLLKRKSINIWYDGDESN